MLLSFTSGFFPLHLDLMIKLLMSLTTGEKSSYEVNFFALLQKLDCAKIIAEDFLHIN